MLLFPFGLSADQIVWWGFVATVVAAACAIWGGVAATAAARLTAKYGKDAPTKEDFRRLEGHAAATSGHLEKVHTNISRMDERLYEQHEHDSILYKAQNASITLQGMGGAGEGLPIDIRLKDPDISVLRLEVYNDDGVLFGGVGCSKVQPLLYKADLDWDLALRWYNGGSQNYARKLLQVRVYMTLGGKQVYRQVPVYMKQDSRSVDSRPNVFATVFIVDGNV